MTFDSAVSLAAELIHEIKAAQAVPRGPLWLDLTHEERADLETKVVDVMLKIQPAANFFPDVQHQGILTVFKRHCFLE
jgi:hypothetical protein